MVKLDKYKICILNRIGRSAQDEGPWSRAYTTSTNKKLEFAYVSQETGWNGEQR